MDNRSEDIRAAGPDELEEFLLGQLDARAYTPTEWELMGYLVKCLDEKGFFSYETEEIARAAGVPKDVVCRCLGVLRKLEPVGIFAKDISECLIRQLERDGCRDELLYRIVREYMEDLLQGHISVISRSLKLSTAKVKEYISRISRLNPRPVMSVAERGVAYVVPDILAEWEKGAWEVRLNDNWTGECRYNQYYIRMMEEAKDRELLQYFQEKLERARFVTDCVEQRRKTLLSVARIILEYQQEYFLGKGPLKPMSMELIAQMAGIHVSTVSRADDRAGGQKISSQRRPDRRIDEGEGSGDFPEDRRQVPGAVRNSGIPPETLSGEISAYQDDSSCYAPVSAGLKVL